MSNLKHKCRQAGSHLYVLPRTARLLWDSSKGWTVIWAAASVVSGIIPILVIRLSKSLIDGLVLWSQPPFSTTAAEPVLVIAALIGAASLAGELLQGGLEW